MNNKILSILTVVYNDISVEETIKSIIPFRSEKVEYIVVDGKSSDGTLEILNKYRDQIDILISIPDNGIYDAMNKAVKVASGKFVLHINSGDSLQNLPLDDLIAVPQNISALTYPCLMDGKVVYKPNYDWKLAFMNRMHHQSTFYRKDEVNYDLQFKIYADHDLNLKLYRKKSNVLVVANGNCISNHSRDGISSVNIKACSKERRTLILKRSGIFILLFSYAYRLFNKVF